MGGLSGIGRSGRSIGRTGDPPLLRWSDCTAIARRLSASSGGWRGVADARYLPFASIGAVSSLAADPVGTRSQFRPDLQGMRAIAVLMVVLSHAGVPHVDGGYTGVDVFFVLSGFLITGLLIRDAAKHDGVDFRDFYARRARRILPAALVTLLATGTAAHILLNFV